MFITEKILNLRSVELVIERLGGKVFSLSKHTLLKNNISIIVNIDNYIEFYLNTKKLPVFRKHIQKAFDSNCLHILYEFDGGFYVYYFIKTNCYNEMLDFIFYADELLYIHKNNNLKFIKEITTLL